MVTTPESALGGSAALAPSIPVAVIGMSARLPGASDIDHFWQNLTAGVESVLRFDLADQLARGVAEDVVRRPNFVPASPTLDGFDEFDAAFFGLTPREAVVRDPQQRIFLEAAHAALESAGYDPTSMGVPVGVYAGTGPNDYETKVLSQRPDITAGLGALAVSVANDPDFIATLTSYMLDLRGPSLTVKTACSTSLVAVHLACEALRSGECEMALAGAAAIELPHARGYLAQEGGVLSADGHCRAFDAEASGTIWGSGVGVLVLKPLDRARADGDNVLAVIRGTAINNDGSTKTGFTAPSKAGQIDVISRALRRSGVDPASVGYVEAHGTATPTGDPIEVAALSEMYGPGRAGRPCALGSVKSNIGHLVSAAGVAGMIKTILSLQHGVIPASLHFNRPNPRLDLDSSPFFVPTSTVPWPLDGLRRAAVSSFGIGGTNAHVIIEQAPVGEPRPTPDAALPELLMLSTRTPEALDSARERLAAHLAAQPEQPLDDVAHTLRVGRTPLSCRATVVASSTSEAADLLRAITTSDGPTADGPPAVALAFPGQGAQHPGMARRLAERFPRFRSTIDDCAAVLQPELGLDIRDLLLRPAEDGGDVEELLARTDLTQPALFTVQYAMTDLLASYGVEPAIMIGHSIGEYTAAAVAGVWDLPDALRLVAARGRLMQEMPEGAMLIVALDEQRLRGMLPADLQVAAINGPRSCVVSGARDGVEELRVALERERIPTHVLRTSHAFHSAMMDPALDRFRACVEATASSAPSLPIISNLTGELLSDEQAQSPDYWTQHLRQPVRFAAGLATLRDRNPHVFCEVGPGQGLSQLARGQGFDVTAAAMPKGGASGAGDAESTFLAGLGQLWTLGTDIDWSALPSSGCRRVALPTYPFERRRHWVDPVDPVEQRAETVVALPAEAPLTAPILQDAVEVVLWDQLPPLTDAPSTVAEDWVVLGDSALAQSITAQLRDHGMHVIEATAGPSYERRSGAAFRLVPTAREDYLHLLDDVGLSGLSPTRFVVAWPLDYAPGETHLPGDDDLAVAQRLAFWSLLALAQALAEHRLGQVRIDVVTGNAQDVVGGDLWYPELATVAGPCKVIPAELPQLTCRQIDVATHEADVAGDVVTELLCASGDPVVALRSRRRWQPRIGRTGLPAEQPTAPWRNRGVYIVTGGLGGVGLSIAEELGTVARARLVLVSRTTFPDRAEWSALLADPSTPRGIRRVIDVTFRIEAAGGEVDIQSADVTVLEQTALVRKATLERYGEVHGILHAAGVPGGGMIQVKDPSAANAVMAPKLYGTVNLERVFGDLPLDVVVLCSSITALIGGLGQVDYCAANAFLDAWAHLPHGQWRRTLSVNWGGWLEVGMAVDAALIGKRAPQPGLITEASADALDSVMANRSTEGEAVVHRGYLHSKQWLLAEHRINGVSVLPAAAQLELMRRAFVATAAPVAGGALELSDVSYAAPILVPDDAAVLVEVVAEPHDSEIRLTLRSSQGDTSRVHTRGIGRWTTQRAARHDVDEIRATLDAIPQPVEGMRALLQSAGHDVELGPRWSSLAMLEQSDGPALGFLEAIDETLADLPTDGLHPALLDEATGFGATPDDGSYLPAGHGKVVIHAPIPAQSFSHLVRNESPRDGAVIRDYVIMDPRGNELVRVEDYLLLRVDDRGALRPDGVTSEPAAAAAATPVGLVPAEAARMLSRAIASKLAGQVIIGAQPLGEITPVDVSTTVAPQAAEPAAAEAGTQQVLLDIYAEALGIDGIEVDDDFFTLGGNSLVAVQVIWQISDRLGESLPMRTFFDHPTIAGLAAVIEQRQPEPR